jgi:glycine cleavage system aminomethyltransferase T
MFKRKDPEPVLFHEEVIRMNKGIVGYISSGAFGFTLGSSVGMGYVHHPEGIDENLVKTAVWEIEIPGERYPAEASLKPLYDPTGTRVKR